MADTRPVSKKAFDDDRGTYKSLKPIPCKAAGCPLRVQLLENPDTGAGLCELHAFAEPKLWPRITEILNDPRCRQLRLDLNKLSQHTNAEWPDVLQMMRNVYKAARDLGLPKEDIVPQKLVGLENGKKVEFQEPPLAYAYRLSMMLNTFVLALAKNGREDSAASERERALSWTDEALARIAGRGRQVMDGPVEEPAAREAA